MVDITHYEVYTDKGDGWKLEERFPVEQRLNAVKYARDREHENISVKLICEKFDVLDNSYQESIEFVSLAQKKKSKNISKDYNDFYQSEGEESTKFRNTIYDALNEEENSLGSIVKALIKLFFIVIFSLLFAHIIVSLSMPLLEEFIPEKASKTFLFLFFFGLFLITATPLILKKIPLNVFGLRRKTKEKIVPERKFLKKAQRILQIYNIDEQLEPGVIPTYPDADIEDKHYIINFLSNIIANLDSKTPLNDDFNRFGIKLVLFGGCMELARIKKLNIAEANSLLNEVFSVLDGKNSEVSEFYEAKRSYKENRVAIFLTGVGAHLMMQLLRREALDSQILHLTFYKWRQQNIIPHQEEIIIPEKQQNTKEKEEVRSETQEKEESYKGSILSCQTRILLNNAENNPRKEAEIKQSIDNIIKNLLGKFEGTELIQSAESKYRSIAFSEVNQALHFAIEFLRDSEIYVNELNDDDIIIAHKLNIVEGDIDTYLNKNSLILDILDNTYDGEVLIEGKLYDRGVPEQYKFDFLGEKNMERSEENIPLYKLITE